jgi:hypothetical protein
VAITRDVSVKETAAAKAAGHPTKAVRVGGSRAGALAGTMAADRSAAAT